MLVTWPTSHPLMSSLKCWQRDNRELMSVTALTSQVPTAPPWFASALAGLLHHSFRAARRLLFEVKAVDPLTENGDARRTSNHSSLELECGRQTQRLAARASVDCV